MRHLWLTLSALLLSLCLLAQQQLSYQEPLKSGQYTVGFRLMELYDFSRAEQSKYAYGKEKQIVHYRPFQLAIWYPAKKTAKSQPMLFEDYFFAQRRERNFAPIDNQWKEQQIQQTIERIKEDPSSLRTPEAFKRVLKTKVASVKDAAPLPGKYPIIVFADEAVGGHTVPAEFLASHGFIVVSYPYLEMGPPMENLTALEGCAQDIGFALHEACQAMNITPDKLIIMGDMATNAGFIYQIRNQNVDAIVGIESFAPRTIRQYSKFDVLSLRAPVLCVGSKDRFVERDSDLLMKAKYADRYVLAFKKLSHPDTYANNFIYNLGDDGVKSSYGMMWDKVLTFLKAYVNNDAEAMREITTWQENDYHTVWQAKSLSPVPTESEFMEILKGENGFTRAMEILKKAKLENPEVVIFKEYLLNREAYFKNRNGDLNGAIQYMQLCVEAFPDAPYANDFLSDYYESKGEKANALQHAKKALDVLQASSLTQKEKESLTAKITQKIERLQK